MQNDDRKDGGASAPEPTETASGLPLDTPFDAGRRRVGAELWASLTDAEREALDSVLADVRGRPINDARACIAAMWSLGKRIGDLHGAEHALQSAFTASREVLDPADRARFAIAMLKARVSEIAAAAPTPPPVNAPKAEGTN